MTQTSPRTQSTGQLVRQAGQLFSATLVGQAMGLVRSIVLPVFFVPAQLGVWNFLLVVFGYGVNVHLGLISGMSRLVPAYNAREMPEYAHRIEESVFWCVLLLGVILSGGIFVYSFFAPSDFQLGLRLLTLAILAQQVFTYFHSYLRAYSQFKVLSLGLVLSSVLSTTLIIGLVLVFPDPVLGAVSGFVMSYVAVALFWFWLANVRFALHIDLPVVGETFIVGLPLITTSILDTLFVSVDRWGIAACCDVNTLGYYALAVMAANLLGGITTVISNVTFPEMIRRFSVRRSHADVSSLYLGSLQLTSLVMTLLVCFAVPTLSFVIRTLLPKYAPSIPLIYILLPTAFFMGLAYLAGPFLVAVDHAWQAAVIQTAALVFSIVAVAFAVTVGGSAQGIAAAALLSTAALCFGYVLPASNLVLGSWLKSIWVGTRLVVPLGLGYGLMRFLEMSLPADAAPLESLAWLLATIIVVSVVIGFSFFGMNPHLIFTYRLLLSKDRSG